jgi:hypothetical protein
MLKVASTFEQDWVPSTAALLQTDKADVSTARRNWRSKSISIGSVHVRWAALALCLAIPFTNFNVNGMALAQDHEQALQSLLADAAAAQSRGDFSAY